MEEILVVLGRSKALWVLVVGLAFAVAVLAYGSHVEAQVAQLADGNQFAPVIDVYRAAFHDHYGKVAISMMGTAALSAWKVFKRDRKKILGY